jgi:hypothetical protein
MRVKPPNKLKYHLRNQRCPCLCGGEGFLVFISCPACGHVALLCDEVATVYPQPHDLNQKTCGWLHDDACPKCPVFGKVELAQFRYSTIEDIRQIGFSSDDIEWT